METLFVVFCPIRIFFTTGLRMKKKIIIFNILMAISIQNLDDDMRALIIYVNELKKIIYFKYYKFRFVKTILFPYRHLPPALYSISVRGFLNTFYLNGPTLFKQTKEIINKNIKFNSLTKCCKWFS